MQFNQPFVQAVIKKTKQIINENRQHLNSQRMGLVNKKTSLETKRNKLEDSLLDDTIDKATYKRMHAKIQDKIYKINDHIQNLEDKNNIDVNLIEEVLSFTRNIHKTYKLAPKFLKRHYLQFFFEKIYIKDKKISRVTPTPIFAILQENQEVIITNNQLPGLDSNQQPSA